MSKLANEFCRKYKTPYLTQNKIFKSKVLYELDYINNKNPEVEEFLKKALPKTEYTYYIYADRKYSDGKRCCNIACTYDEYIDKLSRMSEMEYNVYYSVVSYGGWRTSDRVIEQFKSVYVDIDDLDCDITTMEIDELMPYIADRSNIDEVECSAVVKSGRGSHLYWFVDINNAEQRKKIVENLICRFKSDISCEASSHFIRLPLSMNCKRNSIVKSELYNINNNPFTVSDLLSKYSVEQVIIDEYFEKEKAEITKKRLATMNANKTDKVDDSDTESFSAEELHILDDEIRELCGDNNYEYEVDSNIYDDIEDVYITEDWLEYYESLYSNDTRCWRYRELQALKDLMIYLKRRNGAIEGYRNKFCVCFASKAFNLMSSDRCILILDSLLPDYDTDEIKDTVRCVYAKKKYEDKDKTKTITNIKMKKMLDFKSSDIKSMNCIYNTAERNSKRNKKYAQTKGIIFRNKKEEQKAFITENAGKMTNKEMAEALGVSVSTIKRVKKEVA